MWHAVDGLGVILVLGKAVIKFVTALEKKNQKKNFMT